MNDELSKCYELLGVAPGTSGRELKQAYHDMAKVWHPDRFSHDARLQQKAQEKLKAINEAYELLTAGRAARSARPAPPPGSSYERARPGNTDGPPAASARHGRPQLMLPLAVVFCAAFIAALYFLDPSNLLRPRVQTPAAETQAAPTVKEEERADGEPRPSTSQSARGTERPDRRPPAEATSDAAPGAQQLRPMQTVTVNIDAASGLLATKDCPTVSRMTFPAGAEPKQYCTAPHGKEEPKDSRLKSVAKRVANPGKWLGDGKGAPNGEARAAQPPGEDRPQNR